MSEQETPPRAILDARAVERLRSSPMFQEWLHGGGSIDGPIVVPVITAETDLAAKEIVELHKYAYPAPWALREYRYLCYVAVTSSGQEIDRSEAWPWYNPEFTILNATEPIPPQEQS